MPSLATRFALATLLLTAAALTGCNASSSVAATEGLPYFFGASHDNGDAISTLGANYSIPQGTHHGTHLHAFPSRNDTHATHHSL